MAGAFIDPAESFSRALGQGLATFKSYRDEARQDEDRAFAKQIALAAEDRAKRQMTMSETEHGWRGEQQKEWVDNAPFRKKATEQGIELTEEQIKGAKTDNIWKPKKYAAEIRQSDASAAASYASADYSRAGAARQRGEERRAQIEFNDGRGPAKAFQNWLIGNGPAPDLSGGAKYTPFGFAGHVGAVPTVLSVLQNPTDPKWMSNPQVKAQVMAFAGTGADATLEKKYGWKPYSAGMVDVAPAGNGRVKALFMGIDGKTGRQTQAWVESDAGKFFEQANVRARMLGRIGNDPAVRRQYVEALARDPNYKDDYKQLTGRATEVLSIERAALVDKLKKAPTAAARDAATRAVVEFDKNFSQNVADKTFDLMKMGGEAVAIPATTRAYAYLTQGGNTPQQAARVINDIANNPDVFVAFVKKNGIRPVQNGKPLTDSQIRQMPSWNRALLVTDHFSKQF